MEGSAHRPSLLCRPNTGQYWGELGQGQDDLFRAIARSYPEPFDDLLESNLRYSAVFEEGRCEHFIELLS